MFSRLALRRGAHPARHGAGRCAAAPCTDDAQSDADALVASLRPLASRRTSERSTVGADHTRARRACYEGRRNRDAALSSTRARLEGAPLLGPRTARCRSKARTEAGGETRPASALRLADAGARHAARPSRRPVFAVGAYRARGGANLRRRLRTARLPSRPPLAPGKPRAPDRRGTRSDGARARDDGARRALGAGGESRRATERGRARRPVPRAPAPHAARGAPSAALRLTERSPPRRPVRAHHSTSSKGAARSRLLRAMVRRLAERLSRRHRSATGSHEDAILRRPTAPLAAAHRMASPWADRSRRRAGRSRVEVDGRRVAPPSIRRAPSRPRRPSGPSPRLPPRTPPERVRRTRSKSFC